MNPPPWLIVPVRSLGDGKRRLAGVLDSASRRRLNEGLLAHLLDVAQAWSGLARCVVVSPCNEALAAARLRGAIGLRQTGHAAQRLHRDPNDGLNEGLAQAARWVRRQDAHAALLVVACDLPQLLPADLQALCGDGLRCRVATDVAGTGSNALYLPPGQAAHFAFGTDSRFRHQQLMAAETAHIPGLACDLDTPQDWQALQRPEPCAA